MKRSSDERPKPKLKASHVFRDLWELIWPRRNLFLLGLILTFINRAASLVLPGSTKFLIDDVVQKHRQDLLIPIAAAVAGAILIQALTSYTLIRLLSTSAQRLIAEMRIKVPGAVTALVGSSGSGKSTLIGLVAGFAKPSSGNIYIDDVNLSDVKLSSYRSQLGVVLQDNFLFDGTIKENILFAKPAASNDEVLGASAIARVDEFALKLEKGLETVVGE